MSHDITDWNSLEIIILEPDMKDSVLNEKFRFYVGMHIRIKKTVAKRHERQLKIVFNLALWSCDLGNYSFGYDQISDVVQCFIQKIEESYDLICLRDF